MPFDLSDGTGSDRPIASVDAPPVASGRASDILNNQQVSKQQAALVSDLPFIVCDRPATPLDSAVSGVMWVGLIITVVGIAYLLWGVWSGMLADPHFKNAYNHADRVRIISNLGIVENIVRSTMLVTLAAVLFLFYDISAIGYGLVLVAILLDLGIPWLSHIFLGMQRATPSAATDLSINFINRVGHLPAIPGFFLMALDLIKRGVVGLQSAKVRRTKLKYGQHVAVHAKRRNVFLGQCWNMPYCRDAIRARCPIFLQRKGPCWRHKRGCMCEESIAVLATSPGNWKATVAGAVNKIEGHALDAKSANPLLGFSDGSGRAVMSWEQKKQRCRECVIYNTHQEQKYKASVGILFAAIVLMLYRFNGVLIGFLSGGYMHLNSALSQFSLANNGGGGAVLSNNVSVPVAWFVLCVITILVLSKLLQLVEYCCFTIKI